MVGEGTQLIGQKIADLVLSAYINSAVTGNSHRPYHRGVGKRVQLPVPAVKGEQPFVISEIEDTVFVLGDAPVLPSALIGGIVVINDMRQAQGVLGYQLPDPGEKEQYDYQSVFYHISGGRKARGWCYA
ncbi:hypothetical protein D9M70_535630 [compost metagenome]